MPMAQQPTEKQEHLKKECAPCAASIAELAWTAARNATFNPLATPDPLKHISPPLPDFN